MKGSSKKTMITAAVLMALSSATASAATPGTVDSQELFRSNRLITDHAQQPNVEESSAEDSYEASISRQKKTEDTAAKKPTAPAGAQRVARLHWADVDTRLAARNQSPSFTLVSQKAKPVIITAADVKREERQAAKEGRAPEQLVGKTNNMQGEGLPHVQVVPQNEPPRVMPPRPPVPSNAQPEPHMQAPNTGGQQHMPMPVPNHAQPVHPAVDESELYHPKRPESVPAAAGAQEQHIAEQMAGSGADRGSAGSLEKPQHPRYEQLPHEQFTLNPPADSAAQPKLPSRFDTLNAPEGKGNSAVRQATPIPARSIRPEGVPAYSSADRAQAYDDSLDNISEEVRRHILAGQLAMEIQLQRDPSVAGMRALTQVLRENTTLTHLQKIDFLIGFGRALHRSGLPRQQQALLIKTIAESF